MQSESNAQIAYSGTFGNITAIPCYHALFSKQQYDTVCGDWEGMGGDHAPDFPSAAAALAYISSLDLAVGDGDIIGYNAPLYSLKRNVEGGPRQSVTTYDNTVSIYGLRGEIANGWTYDVSYQLSDVEYTQEYRNDLSVIAMNRAIDVISVNGTPTCVAALNGTDPSCIPYNLFQGGLPGDGGIQGVIDGGAALQQYIANSTFVRGTGEQSIVQAVASGEFPLTLPGAPSPISAAFGVEAKDLSTDYRPDRPSRTGDRSGSGGATLPLAGGYDVDEYFVELGIPVLDNLSFDAGYRYADYSTGHSTNTYKLGAFWQVSDDVALRASFQSAIRHASLYELFRAQGFNLVDLPDDPCGLSMSASQSACANTGLAANLYGTDLKSPADQYNILQGGNEMVAPEESASFTAGLVATPAFIEGLTLTLDYFDINVEQGIGTVPAATALQKCLDTGLSAFCDLINRHPGNGSLWLTGGYISAQTTNLSEENVKGVDIIFDYDLNTPIGPVELQGVSTYLITSDLIELPGEEALECAGYWGTYCGKNPQPQWRRQLQGDVHDALRHPRFAGAAASRQDRGPGFQRDRLRFRNLLGSDGGVERHRQLHRHRGYQQPVRHRPASQFRRGHRAGQRQHVPGVLRRAGPLCVRQPGGELLREVRLNRTCLAQEQKAGTQSRPFFCCVIPLGPNWGSGVRPFSAIRSDADAMTGSASRS